MGADLSAPGRVQKMLSGIAHSFSLVLGLRWPHAAGRRSKALCICPAVFLARYQILRRPAGATSVDLITFWYLSRAAPSTRRVGFSLPALLRSTPDGRP